MVAVSLIKALIDKSPLLSKLNQIRKSPRYIGKILCPDTFFWTACYANFLKVFFLHRYIKRLWLAKKFTANNYNCIQPELGYALFDLSKSTVLQNAIDQCVAYCEKHDLDDMCAKAKKPFLLTHDLHLLNGEFPAVYQLALDPMILGAVAKYLGIFPVLVKAQIWYSPNKEFFGRSQKFHIDGEDSRQVKCFIPLQTISKQTGPLTVIPAQESRLLFQKLQQTGQVKYRNTKIDDELLFAHSQLREGCALTAEPGTVVMVDTCRCYHFGSRPSQTQDSQPRLLLHLHYQSPFSRMLPLWGLNKKARQLAASPEAKNLFSYF